MLTMPENAGSAVTILGIDPGSTSLGLAVIRFSAVFPHEIISSNAGTVRADRLIPKECWLSDVFGERQSRLDVIENEIYKAICEEQPIQVACESPFYNRLRPNAYGVLMEVICRVRRAVFRYNWWTGLFMIDPPTVKKSVGAKGNAGKDDVKAAVMKLKGILKYEGDTPFELLDEHSLDAYAVAYGRYICYLEEMLCLKP
jgi:Holliday junction resolvasome RuvABC endonuclease subunit